MAIVLLQMTLLLRVMPVVIGCLRVLIVPSTMRTTFPPCVAVAVTSRVMSAAVVRAAAGVSRETYR
jgi:hypothetical protein